MAVCFIISLLIPLYIAYRLYQHFFPYPNINPKDKYVLISGCDTGFGHTLAIELDKQGFNVLAGVYTSNNIIILQNKLSPKATVFQLDITKQEDIDSAYELIRKKTNTLHALVNNAGVGIPGYIDWITLESMRKTMDVNFFGHVAMTKTFLPLLISKRNSRVINITSVAGILAGPNLSATNTLHALVNNAGVGIPGYIDWITLESMRKTMDVNFFGHVAMTKTFLPLLISKRNSRVINITSVAGILAGPNLSAYAASKYALESFSDCLRREMYRWNLRVSIIEPGFMKTPIIEGVRKPFDDFWKELTNDVQERWGKDSLNEIYDGPGRNIFIKHAEDPMKVVRALQHAVMNTNPHIRYQPGCQSSLFFYPLSMLPAWLVDFILVKTDTLNFIPASISKQLKD
ncbi:unnamed protein product [Adineta steineri]|uniref:Uncharacterized protein n=1 Tax=Adineta steineri TaxID=433720 RepID=A0A814NV97_9BILA|nr:unnamed protein product [Adineta steineri]